METAQYPASLEIDYPDRSLNRLTTFFRIFTVIPIAIVLGSLSGSDYTATYGRHTTTYAFGAAGLLFIPVLLMLLFRRKYPGWWFDWNLELTRSRPASAPTSRCWTTPIRPPTRNSRCISRSSVPTANSCRDGSRW